MELDLKTIGSRIRALRKQHGWTQEALAERADLSVPFLSHIERGKKSAGLSTLIKLAAALDTTVDFLLFESPPAVPLVLCPDIHTLLADCSEQELQIIYETTVTLKRLLRAYPPI